MPARITRSGLPRDMRPSSNRTSSARKAPSEAASVCSTRPTSASRKSATVSPPAAPALTPITSGLAIGLAVSRWSMQPATASSTPPESADTARGSRSAHGEAGSPGRARLHPSSPRPSRLDRMSARSSSAAEDGKAQDRPAGAGPGPEREVPAGPRWQAQARDHPQQQRRPEQGGDGAGGDRPAIGARRPVARPGRWPRAARRRPGRMRAANGRCAVPRKSAPAPVPRGR